MTEDELKAIENWTNDWAEPGAEDTGFYYIRALLDALRERNADVLALTTELETVRSAATREQKQHLEEIARLERLVAQRDEEAAEMQSDIAALPLLVRIAAREQRYACVDNFNAVEGVPNVNASSLAQNTACPDSDTVLSIWRQQRDSDRRGR